MQFTMRRNSRTLRAFRTATLLFGIMWLLAFTGCNQKNSLEKVIVSGTVKYDGELIPNGEILFYPIEGTKGSVSGGPIKDGKYTAKGRGGVVVGKHRVEIRAFRTSSRSWSDEEGVEGGPAEQYLPLQYNSYSELTCEVDAANAVQDFDLSAK